ncbi:GspE/PulE family protein [Herbivorax sp. ANBcel31]|uniref:GspE/PulE family protein n=1 Tax=Herbivorax sp. ANBcel31 TaxID=3069754 RepID=UPI0027AEE2E9|nr:GspE/PulE family protein [Herbivorax sp. ANBcel31]MDQ2087832.1 GspE/PulE family protein [Herbivorax sp. ANBcel31]
MNNPNVRLLGDLLLDLGWITAEQLNIAIKLNKTSGRRIDEILIKEGFISQDEIIKVLEFKLGIPSVKVEEYGVEQEACAIIPESLARRYVLIPLKIYNNVLTVAMSDPVNVYAIDDLRIISRMEIQPVISTSQEIKSAISKYYSNEKAIKAVQDYLNEKKIGSKESSEDDNESIDSVDSAPIVKLVNTILEQAVRKNASDIHIEPFDKNIKVRYRIDGRLKESMTIKTEIMQSLLSRIKILGNMNISEKRLPQDGRISAKVDGISYDFRVSTIPIIHGEKIVLRITDKKSLIMHKSQLGFRNEDLKKYDEILQNPHGLILVTGSTGSGKTTTLYSAIKELNESDVNIVSIEDPIETTIDGVSQIQTNVKIGLDFASGLKSVLRQDPDIIVVGEMRDAETAEIATRAAITGHLVLSTIHTNDAPSTVVRLIDMGIEPFLVASSIVGVISQRLVRKICGHCKFKYTPSPEELEILNLSKSLKLNLYKGEGCAACLGTGYKGRIGVYEIMKITKHHKHLISNNCDEDELRNYSIENGMKTIRDNAIELVVEGVTTIDELKRASFLNE